MAKNYSQPGAYLDWTNDTGSQVASGEVVVAGDCLGVAMTDIAAGASGVIAVEGVFEVAKKTGSSWVLGQKLDYDASAGDFVGGLSAQSGDVTDGGVAAGPAASAATTGYIKLTPGVGTRA